MGEKECCGVNFIKNALNVFNIFLLFAGIGVLAVAIWTRIDRYDYVDLLPSLTYPILIYFLISAGILVILVSFIGCFSALKDHRPLLLFYIFALLLIFVIEAMVGIVAYIYEENIHTELDINLNTTLLTTYKIDESKTDAADFLQETFHCCGAVSFRDWRHSNWLQNNSIGNRVPDSCCKTISEGCGDSDHPSNINYAGCQDLMEDHLIFHLVILSGVGLGICILQIFGVVLAFKLYLKLKNQYTIEETRRFV